MKLEINWVSGMNFKGTTPSGHETHFDSPENGQPGAGPSPMEVVLQSSAVCSAIDVVMILEKMKKDIKKFWVEVDAERRDEHPRIYTKIKYTFNFESPDLKNEEADKAIKLSIDKYCSVLGMLKDTVNIEWESKIN